MTNLIPCRGWNWRICLGQANGTLALVVMLIAQVIVATPSAQAQTYKVLYSFTGGADGAFPFGALVGDHAGNLYGTTPYGGASGYGTVFKLDTTGKETVLYSFTGGRTGHFPEPLWSETRRATSTAPPPTAALP